MGTAYPGVSHGHSATQHGHMCPCSVRCHHLSPLPRIPLHCQANPSTAVPPHSATRLQTGYRTYLKFLQNRKDSTWGGGCVLTPNQCMWGRLYPNPCVKHSLPLGSACIPSPPAAALCGFSLPFAVPAQCPLSGDVTQVTLRLATLLGRLMAASHR